MPEKDFTISLRENGEHSFKRSLESYQAYENSRDLMFLKDTIMFGSMSSCVEKLRGWLRLRYGWHCKLVELETANDGVEKQHAAPLVAKRGSHLVRATFDLPKESFDNIIGANRLPVLFGERIESQAGIEIALQALDGRRINGLIFLDKSSDCLISFCSPSLIKQGFQFWFDLVALFGRDVTEYVFHLVHHTALPFGGGELGLDRIEHGLTAIADPQIDRFHPSGFEIVQEVFPCLLILPISHTKGEHVSLPRRSNANHGQDGHLAAFSIVDHREVRSIRKGICIPLG